MVRSFPLLYLAAVFLVTTATYAQENSISLGFDAITTSTADAIDAGPSSGPFSNKPGWPKLDGSSGSDGVATTAPPIGLNPDIVGLVIAAPTTVTSTPKTPMTQAPAQPVPATKGLTTQAPTTQAPATKSHVTQAPATKETTTQVPMTKSPVVTPAKGAAVTLAPTTGKSTTIAPKNTTHNPIIDPPHCPKCAVHVSVKGVKGVYCVADTGAVCSAQHPKGNCPGPQRGLKKGSHCSVIQSNVYGCVPGAGRSKHKDCHE